MCTEPYKFDIWILARKIKSSSVDLEPMISAADDRKLVAAVQPAGAGPGLPPGAPAIPVREDCLYQLLDSLIALRLGFANGTDGDQALAMVSRARALEIRTILDTAIHKTKRVIEDVQRARAPKRA